MDSQIRSAKGLLMRLSPSVFLLRKISLFLDGSKIHCVSDQIQGCI